jgi:hypothetical protein
MENARFVRGFETCDDLLDGSDGILWTHGAFAGHLIFEVAAVDAFHGDDGLAGSGLFHAKNEDTVRVADGGGQLAFAKEALLLPGVGADLMHDLQGDDAAAFQVLGFVHAAHATLSEEAENPVAVDFDGFG